MVIVEGHCTKLQLLISYIYNHWLTQKYSEFWLVRYIGVVWSNIAVTLLLPSYIYDTWLGVTRLNLKFSFKILFRIVTKSIPTLVFSHLLMNLIAWCSFMKNVTKTPENAKMMSNHCLILTGKMLADGGDPPHTVWKISFLWFDVSEPAWYCSPLLANRWY